MNFKLLYIPFLLLLCFAQSGYPQRRLKAVVKNEDEFIGPFDSWLNAKTKFGATGDGVTDDTQALQAAFDAAARGDVNSTLYIPAGTYLITGTLNINYQINVSIVGAGADATMIKWGGAAHGTMMRINGTAYSKFNRITFNGSSIADVAVEQSWDGSRPHFDTSNEYADDVFIDVAFGIRGGALGHGFAEASILHDQFIRNTSAGVSLGNFNALDVWIRNCSFEECATGVTNTYGAGNFRVYGSTFRNSTVSDMSMHNTGGFSVRGNTSINSNQFFNAALTRNPATTIIEGNTVIDPVNTQAITVANQGPTVFINNKIRSRVAAGRSQGAVIGVTGNSHAFYMGNTFTVANPVSTDSLKIEHNDKVVTADQLGALIVRDFVKSGKPRQRQIFEVPPGANAGTIQAAIDKAVAASGIVHLPYGNYDITTTLFIPANADIQLVGDGYGNGRGTALSWKGTAPGAIISVAGPTRATFRDLTLKGNNTSTNLLVTNADQPASRIFLQEFNQAGGQTGLLADHLDHTLVFGYDSQFSGLQNAINVIGGPLAAAGKPGEARVIIYSGATSNNVVSHQVSNGGNLMVQDTWYEGSIKSQFVNLSDNSIFIAAADRIATPQHADAPSIAFNNFSGRAAFVANDFTGYFGITGDCSRAKILALGMMAEEETMVSNDLASATDARVLLSRARVTHASANRVGSYTVSTVGAYDPEFVEELLTPMLNFKPAVPAKLPKGVTDIMLYRVMSLGGAVGVRVEAGR